METGETTGVAAEGVASLRDRIGWLEGQLLNAREEAAMILAERNYLAQDRDILDFRLRRVRGLALGLGFALATALLGAGLATFG